MVRPVHPSLFPNSWLPVHHNTLQLLPLDAVNLFDRRLTLVAGQSWRPARNSAALPSEPGGSARPNPDQLGALAGPETPPPSACPWNGDAMRGVLTGTHVRGMRELMFTCAHRLIVQVCAAAAIPTYPDFPTSSRSCRFGWLVPAWLGAKAGRRPAQREQACAQAHLRLPSARLRTKHIACDGRFTSLIAACRLLSLSTARLWLLQRSALAIFEPECSSLGRPGRPGLSRATEWRLLCR